MSFLHKDKATTSATATKPVQAKAPSAADKLRGVSFDAQVQMLAPPGAASLKADASQKGAAPVQMDAAPGAGYPVLQLGSKGSDVFKLQALLNVHGARIQVDGDFGKITEAAVKAYQKSQGLAVDGIVEEKTWAALDGGGGGTTTTGGGGTNTVGDGTTTTPGGDGTTTTPGGGGTESSSQTGEGAGGSGPAAQDRVDSEQGEAPSASSSNASEARASESPANVAPDEPATEGDGDVFSADAESPAPTNAENMATDVGPTAALAAALEAKVQGTQAKLESVQKQIKRLSDQLKKLQGKKAKFVALGVLLSPVFLLKIKKIDRDIRKTRNKLTRHLQDMPRLATQLAQQKAELAQKKAELARLGGGSDNAGDTESPSSAETTTPHGGPATGPAAGNAIKVHTTQKKLEDTQKQVKGLSSQIKTLETAKAKFTVLGMFLAPIFLLKIKGIDREIRQKRNKLKRLLPELVRLTTQLAQEKAELARRRRSSAPA